MLKKTKEYLVTVTKLIFEALNNKQRTSKNLGRTVINQRFMKRGFVRILFEVFISSRV